MVHVGRLLERVKRIVRAATIVVGSFWLLRLVKLIDWRRRMNARFPGPKAGLIMGNVGDIRVMGGLNARFFQFLHEQYGDIVRYWVGTKLHLSVTNADTVAQICRTTEIRPKNLLGAGLFGQANILEENGAAAKLHREQLIQILSNSGTLQCAHAVSISTFARETRKWKDDPVQLHEALGPALFDVVGQVVFGPKWSESSQGKYLFEAYETVARNGSSWSDAWVPPIWNASYREFARARRSLEELCESAIKTQQASSQDMKTANSVLAVLQKSKDDLLLPVQVSTLLHFFHGSYVTLRSALYWVLYNLARHQDVQNKLQEEVFANLGRKLPPTVEELKELEYMDAVLQESLRLHCPIGVTHRVNSDQTLCVQGFMIPRGAVFSMPLFLTLRDERWFGPEPNSFVPERFSGSSPQAKLAQKSFLAFGGGARMCVGFELALIQLRSIVATILQRYNISLAKGTEDVAHFYDGLISTPEKDVSFVFVKHKGPDFPQY